MKESINLIPSPPSGSFIAVAYRKLALFAVIAVFLFESVFISLLIARSKFDRDIFHLKNSLEQGKRILSETENVETTIRTVQDKLETIRDLRFSRKSFLRAIKYIPTLIPEDVKIVTINLNINQLQVVAVTISGSSFAKMVDNFYRSARFTDLTLTGSTFDEKLGRYTFTFEAGVEEAIFK